MEIKGERSLVSDSKLIAGLFRFMAPTAFSKSLRALQAKGRPSGDDEDRGRDGWSQGCASASKTAQKLIPHNPPQKRRRKAPRPSILTTCLCRIFYFFLFPRKGGSHAKEEGNFVSLTRSLKGEQLKGRFKNGFSLLL